MKKLRDLIIRQKIDARRKIASMNLEGGLSQNEYCVLRESGFLNYNFSDVSSLDDFLKVVHAARHNGPQVECIDCKALYNDFNEMQDVVEIEEDNLPRAGNLLSVLKEEAEEEKQHIERSRIPSQNDLRRWALKDAVLSYYQGLNMPDDIIVVKNKFDDRLITEFAPDFSVIYNVWLTKLDELRRKNERSKFKLLQDEYDQVEEDILEGMRGSAFEKQLDRYRIEFVQKLQNSMK